MPARYIFVSGGVISGIGKGITTASLSLLLTSRGYTATLVKCENYLNLDSGLINPIEHGDPFLMDDGTEADMDLGTYEKFLGKNMTRANFVTMGQIYKQVIDNERNFLYNGEDVEAIPHVTDEILRRIEEAGAAEKADIIVVELGGTAGEYQNILFYEASRILALRDDVQVIHVHVSYLPTPKHLGEPKTKPTQLSVKTLNGMGIQPDFIVARSETPLDDRRRERFALFCNVKPGHVIVSQDERSPYEVPVSFAQQRFDIKVLEAFELPAKKVVLTAWKDMCATIHLAKPHQATIAIVGKYFATGSFQLRDSYAALLDAIDHAAWRTGTNVELRTINAEKLEAGDTSELKGISGLIVPIGWGNRGVEGKIAAIEYARTQKIPYLGLCYGMQLAVVEFARHVAHLTKAHTTECDPNTPYPVVHQIPGQAEVLARRAYGGTMRLGRWECRVNEGTIADQAYASARYYDRPRQCMVGERHRHRYEFNDAYAEQLQSKGLVIAGRSVVEGLVEIIELPQSVHPFFVATQYHPEYRSRPLAPHPLFMAFMKAQH